MALFLATPRATAQEELIDVGAQLPIDQIDLIEGEVEGDVAVESDVRICNCIGASNTSPHSTVGYVCPVHGPAPGDSGWLYRMQIQFSF